MSDMMSFPDSALAWAFYLALIGLAVAASYTDLRKLIIPKQLSISTLALGVMLNVMRGYWLGSMQQPVWQLEASSGAMGALDGLLFSLAGFGAAFALFLVMWVLGTCGGGDVKFFAAVGAWVGPMGAIFVLAGTIFFVVLLSLVRIIGGVFAGGFGKTMKDYSLKEGKPTGEQGQKTTRRRLMAYSLPIALSCATVLFIVWHKDLLGTRVVQP